MKKIIISSILVGALLVACSKKGAATEENFMKDFELDLSEWKLDLSKPSVQKYSSQMQRDSLVNELAQELFEIRESMEDGTAPKYTKILLSLSEEAHTVTTQLREKDKVDFTTWNDLGICENPTCLTSKMNEIIAQNPSAAFGIEFSWSTRAVKMYLNTNN